MYVPPRPKFIQRQRQGLQDIDSARTVSSETVSIDICLLSIQGQLMVAQLQKVRSRGWT